jgi:hypothetical protein
MKDLVPFKKIRECILEIRGLRVMLDEDLAKLYGVTTKALVQAVKRNGERFPKDFMFVLTRQEFTHLRSQTVTSKSEGRGGRRTLPLAFTEQGVAMLSSVLRSPQAIQVNIAIMRAFVLLRQTLIDHEELSRRLAALDKKLAKHDDHFAVVFRAINELMKEPEPKRNRTIGFLGDS